MAKRIKKPVVMPRHKENWFGRRLIITAIVLVFVITISFISVSKYSDKTKFIGEYNLKLENANKLIAEHDALISEINSNFGKNDSLHYEKINDYIEWVELHRSDISDFKLFIESNYDRLKRLNVNPDYSRDNIKSVLQIMQENELKFRTFSVYYESMKNE